MSALPPRVIAPADPQLYGDFARKLLEDKGGALLSQYRQEFDSARMAARRKLHAPLPPEEYEANAAIAESTELCTEVINAVWNSMHTGT